MNRTDTELPPVIPDYELLRMVGSGSYGDVWLARSITGHYRAIKIIWRDRFKELTPYEREFNGLREFAAVSLTEPHQLALLHVGQKHESGFFYYVMELADDVLRGRRIEPASYIPHTLRETRERSGRMPAVEVVALAAGIAKALAGLHARGLVHRDVKPSNVIIVNGVPKLADIGLVSAATTAQTFVGTEGFVPPEGPGSPGADVFGLGKLLYEMSTGLDRHEYPRLPSDLDQLSDGKELLELNEILIKACEPRPGERYRDAAAMLDDLLVLQSGRSMRRLRLAERRWSRSVRSVLIVGIVAGVVTSGAFLERKRAAHESERQNVIDMQRSELAEQNRYRESLTAARLALQTNNRAQAERELRKFIPAPGTRDVRDREWLELWRQIRVVAENP